MGQWHRAIAAFITDQRGVDHSPATVKQYRNMVTAFAVTIRRLATRHA